MFEHILLFEAEWRIYIRICTQVISGSDNGLSPVRRRVIILISADTITIRP